MDKLKLIKIAVVAMTFLLIAGSLFMLTTLYRRLNNKPAEIERNINLGEADGSFINNMLECQEYICIVVKGGALADRIVIFDPDTGKKVSTVSLY